MAQVVGRFKKGKIQIAVVKGNFEGQTSISYTLKKQLYDKETKKWKDSDFLGITDMQDILTLATRICSSYVKYDKVEPKPKQEEAAEEPFDHEEAPF